MIISGLVLLRMRNVSDKSCKEFQNTHFIFSNFFKNCAIDEIMWKNTVEPDRSQMTVRCMCSSRWIPKATNAQFQNM